MWLELSPPQVHSLQPHNSDKPTPPLGPPADPPSGLTPICLEKPTAGPEGLSVLGAPAGGRLRDMLRRLRCSLLAPAGLCVVTPYRDRSPVHTS